MKTADKTSKRIVFIKTAAVVMIVAALIGTGILAKYVRSVIFQGNVTFASNLADDFKVSEHKAVKQDDGSYTLNDEETSSNTYKVMPGVDIPKDPFITLTNKSDVPAYLYIEIVDTSTDTVTYELTEEWTKIDNCKGSNGGDIYSYAYVLGKDNCSDPISVLKDNLIRVSKQYDENTNDFNVTFYGYLLQKEDDKSAEQTFRENYGSEGI